jgi:hypothetical protein
LALSVFQGACAGTTTLPPILHSGVEPGTAVEITAPVQDLNRSQAVLLAPIGEQVFVRLGRANTDRSMPVGEVTELRIVTRQGHAGIGLLVGTAVGFVFAGALMNSFPQQSAGESLPVVLVPAVLGLFVGAMNTSTRIQPIDLPQMQDVPAAR